MSLGQKRGPRVAGSTALPLKHNGQTEKLTAGTAPSLEDITPSPRLTNSPQGSSQTNATSALLASPGCGVCAVCAARLRPERPLPPGGFRGGCCRRRRGSRDEPLSNTSETPPQDGVVGPRGEWSLHLASGSPPSWFRSTLHSQHDEWSFWMHRKLMIAPLFNRKLQTHSRRPSPKVERHKLFLC